jgi:hypothetical protein
LNNTHDSLSRYQGKYRAIVPFNTLKETEDKFNSLSSQIQGKQQIIEGKYADIQGIKQELQVQLKQHQGAVNSLAAERESAQNQVKNTKLSIKDYQQRAIKADEEIKIREKTRELLELRADRSGIISNPKLDTLKNNPVREKDPILEIFDPHQLSVEIKATQEDKDLVLASQKGKTKAKFCPRNAGGKCYQGMVQDIDNNRINKTDTAPQPTLIVRISLDQLDEMLAPGMQGYGHIESPWIPTYQKAWRQLCKLVQPGRWGAG